MTRFDKTLIVLVAMLTAVAAAVEPPASAADWPGWRGPRRDGISREKGLLQKWSEGGPPLAWATNLCGEGYGAPAVVGNRVYLMGNGPKAEWVVALNIAKGGTQEWASATGPIRHQGGGYPGPRSTPTVDGDRVYALGMAGILVCLSADDGRVIWHRNLVEDFGGSIPQWGYSESVLVDRKFVVCTPGGKENTIVALNKDNGKKVWGAALGDPAGYSSVIKARIGRVSQYVAFTARGVVGVEANTGRPLWRYDAPANPTANIATPIWYRDTIFASSADKGGGLVWPRRTPKGFMPQQVYFTKQMQNHHGGMVPINDFLFGCSNPNVLTCLNYRTGEVLWTDRSSGKCSIIYADRRLYLRSEDGPISLVTSSRQDFVLQGRFNQPFRSNRKAWTHLVIANGMMYVRDQNVLLCYDIRDREETGEKEGSDGSG